MALNFARGTQKPPLGARVNFAHPFAKDLRVAVLLNETHGVSAPGTVVRVQVVTAGSAPPFSASSGSATGLSWASNLDGHALKLAVADGNSVLLSNAAGTDPIPTGDTTILFIQRKTDTTLRNAAHFAGSTDAAKACAAYLPYGGNPPIFDFGGTSGANRLTGSGWSVTTNLQRWVFTAGARGSSIWCNGVKLASQSTAITRTASDGIYLNGGAFGGNWGDNQEINFFQVIAAQWSDELCRSWSAEPYAHLYSEAAHRRYFLLGDLAAGAAGAFTFRRTLSPQGTQIGHRQEHA